MHSVQHRRFVPFFHCPGAKQLFASMREHLKHVPSGSVGGIKSLYTMAYARASSLKTSSRKGGANAETMRSSQPQLMHAGGADAVELTLGGSAVMFSPSR